MKKPEPGKVKTRLAKTIGDDQATEIYKLLLEKTKKEVKEVDCVLKVFYWPEVLENDIWSFKGVEKHIQVSGELGEKMHAAFSKAFQDEANQVVIIGTDCYELDSSIITRAFDGLKQHDVVIGPTYDGGYYLLGMNKLHSDFFKNKQWSTSSVYPSTIEDVTTLKLRHLDLPKLTDIDEWQDLKLYPELVKNIEYPIDHEHE